MPINNTDTTGNDGRPEGTVCAGKKTKNEATESIFICNFSHVA